MTIYGYMVINCVLKSLKHIGWQRQCSTSANKQWFLLKIHGVDFYMQWHVLSCCYLDDSERKNISDYVFWADALQKLSQYQIKLKRQSAT